MIPLHGDTAGRRRIRTTVGVPMARRLSREARRFVREQLERGPFLAAFDEVGSLRDISSDPDRVHLVTIRDVRILERFDDLRSSGRAG